MNTAKDTNAMQFLNRRLLWCVLFGFFFFLYGCTEIPTDHTEILWDEWGVPHIHAASSEQLMYAFGWAQMHNHANRILQLYGIARGRAAEYWGEEYLQSDQYIHTMGVPDRSQSWFDQQSPKMQRFTQAFVAGMNAYTEDHPGAIQSRNRQVLPVQVTDPNAYLQRLIHFTLLPRISRTPSAAQQWTQQGSNGWALAPSKTISGQSMLLINPHLWWAEQFTLFEAQLTSPEYNVYGATFLGLPIIAVGFNHSLGWTATNNTIDGVDLYQLHLTDGGYRWNGSSRDFNRDTARIRIRHSADSLSTQVVPIHRSIHGPVIERRGDEALAIRIVGLDQPHLFEQLWDMGRASTLSTFQSAISRLQLPMFNLLYADREGHILYFFGGRVPVRSVGDWDYWQKVLPGDTSETLWTGIHSYEELPKVIDPPSGWVQNANGPPWNATFPRQIHPDSFPAYLTPNRMGQSPGPGFRPQRSIQMLQSDSTISFTELQEYKHSTRMAAADRLLDDLLPLLSNQNDSLLQRAGRVLTSWDRQANAASRGAILFTHWYDNLSQNVYAEPWQYSSPLTTPDGIADTAAALQALRTAANRVQRTHGRLDIPWGKVHRLQVGKYDFPGNGAGGKYGVFRVTSYTTVNDTLKQAFHGDSFVALVAFANPVRAKVLLSYGNASQEGSPHYGDQLELYIRKELRTAWLTRDSVEAHLSTRDTVTYQREQ